MDVNEYYPKMKARDDKARMDFLNLTKNLDISGIFMRDILREEIKNDDPRLF